MPSLFDAARFGALALPNRVVMAPMTRRRADAAAMPGPLAAEYYAQRATAGLVIAEATLVTRDGASYPGSPGIWSEAHARAWRAVVDAVHAGGGRIALQLWHAGRFSDPEFLDGATPVAPSAIAIEGEVRAASGARPFVTPRALDASELPGIARAFADAARRARDAGFDGVEVHAAQGYLLDQFLRDGSNRRDDDYGGAEGRARFPLEVIDAVCAAVGADRVGVQISPTSALGGMSDSDPAATFGAFARRLSSRGLAYLHVFEPLGGDAPRLTPALRSAFAGALVANGNYDGASARRAIEEGSADAVSFGRPFIANPDLVRRLRDGAPLARPDPATFYGGGARGYTDYPALD